MSFPMLFETIIYVAKYFKSSWSLLLEYVVILLSIYIMYDVQEVGEGELEMEDDSFDKLFQ